MYIREGKEIAVVQTKVKKKEEAIVIIYTFRNRAFEDNNMAASSAGSNC